MISDRYTKGLNRWKWLVIPLWVLVLVGVGLAYAPNLINETQWEYGATADAESSQATRIMEERFADWTQTSEIIVVLQRSDGSFVLGNDTRLYTFEVADRLMTDVEEVTHVYGYYLLENTPMDAYKNLTVSPDGLATIIEIGLDSPRDNIHPDLVKDVRDVVHAVVGDSEASDLKAYVTGFGPLEVDTMEMMKHDIERIDLIVLPLSFLLLVFLLRSLRMAILSISIVGMSILITFGLLERGIVLGDIVILNFVPTVVLSITLGIGVDYSLFTLARFREERLKGRSVLRSVRTMLQRAGHNIMVSGLTLAVATVGLVLFPLSIISSLGLALSLAVLLTLLANLTLIPAILLVAGTWFASPKPDAGRARKPRKSYWTKVGRVATTRAPLVLLIVVLLSIPVSLQVLDFEYGTSTESMTPPNSESRLGYDVLRSSFAPGLIAPVVIVMESTDGVLTPEFFADQHGLVSAVVSNLDVSPLLVSAVAWLDGAPVPIDLATLALTTPDPTALPPSLQLYRHFAEPLVSDDGRHAYVEMIITQDPYGPDGQQFISDLRGLIQGMTWVGTDAVYVGGAVAIHADVEEETYALFPGMIFVVIGAVYVLIGVLFRSATLPLRLLATIGLTISFIYGAAMLVFLKAPVLEGLFPSLADADTLFFLLPIMSFSIILGLGLDYDIFLVERIKEYVWKGHRDKEAIVLGIKKTGGLITGAGGVMVIALGGLMFSEVMILKQFGFFLAFAVLMDTFVVRTLLVPAIMSLAKGWNWWPSKPPARTPAPRDPSVEFPQASDGGQ